MKKSFIVGYSSQSIRLDKWIKENIGQFPQSLIEKNLRIGKIKLNNKKVKSSTKLKLNDEITLYNFNYKKNNISSKQKYKPNNQIIRESENKIIHDNENFIVVNKESGMPVQGGTKSKVNLIFQ